MSDVLAVRRFCDCSSDCSNIAFISPLSLSKISQRRSNIEKLFPTTNCSPNPDSLEGTLKIIAIRQKDKA